MSNENNYRAKAVRPMHQTVAIVGRPNVGKSALFNKIIGRRMSIVHSTSGVTRDRVAAMATFENHRFMVVDTGGLGIFNDEKRGDTAWDLLIREQLHVALDSADKVLFVVDAPEGVQTLDEEVANMLRESGKPVIVVANKSDNPILADNAQLFEKLGFKTIIPTSCTHNSGIQNLLWDLCEDMPVESDDDEEEKSLKIAVVGRPNVGKSSIINRLLGEDRVIVSEVAGTTRDAIDVPFVINDGDTRIPAVLVDTAGLRKKGKIDCVVEFFSMARTLSAINHADVIVLVLDASCPGTAQDRKISRMVLDAGKPCLMTLNKWDLASSETKQKELYEETDHVLPFMKYAPKMTTCATSGYNFKDIIPKIIELSQLVDVEYPTSLVNRVIQDATLRMPPPNKGGRMKVYYATCVKRCPPTFVAFVNDKTRCPDNYATFLKNQFIQAFGIYGMPVLLELRNRKRDDQRKGIFKEKTIGPGRDKPKTKRKPKGTPNSKGRATAKPAAKRKAGRKPKRR